MNFNIDTESATFESFWVIKSISVSLKQTQPFDLRRNKSCRADPPVVTCRTSTVLSCVHSGGRDIGAVRRKVGLTLLAV